MANDLVRRMRTLAGEAGVGGFPATEAMLHDGADRIEELEAENRKAWRERNEAVTRVKAWEAIVCLVTVRAVTIDEWGEGEGEIINVKLPPPEKLTDILEEVRAARAYKGE